MKRISTLLILIMTTALIATQTFAQQPIISNNIVVLQNITSASQCPANYRGTGQPTNIEGTTPWGPQSGTSGAVVQSCSGCYFTPSTRTCTCRICYGGYN